MAYKFSTDLRQYGRYLGATLLDVDEEFRLKLDRAVCDAKYVTCAGWRPESYTYLYDYLTGSKTIQHTYILEIFQPNVARFPYTHPNLTVVCGDIKEFEKYIPAEHRDVLIWQDGPEHLSMDDSIEVLGRLKRSFNKVIISTPNGIYPQGEWRGNIYETHLSTWYPEDYTSLGFDCRVYNTNGSGPGILGIYSK